MLTIGLIDAEMKNNDLNKFPNLPLMKISSYYKSKGYIVQWYDKNTHYDVVYISKVFSFTPDIDYEINSDVVIKGGSGYAIKLVDGKEIYSKELDNNLPECIECCYPDYDLYNIKDTAYGFITKGCPRKCDFCHVKNMQGTTPHYVGKLNDFWKGQPNIVLLDPNITAFANYEEVFNELILSKAYVDFSQGLDIRCITPHKAELLSRIKIKRVHFAYDRYEDKKIVERGLKYIKEYTNWNRSKVSVYVLTNFNTTLEEDLERIYFIRSLNFQPYVMRYNKENIPRGHIQNSLARWVNFPSLFWKYETFDQYLKEGR